VIAGAGGPGQGKHGGLDGGRGDGIEIATQGQEPALTGNELAAIALGGAQVLGEDRSRVVGVAGLGAVVDEAAHRVFPGELQEGALVEGRGTTGGEGSAGSAGSASASSGTDSASAVG